MDTHSAIGWLVLCKFYGDCNGRVCKMTITTNKNEKEEEEDQLYQATLPQIK